MMKMSEDIQPITYLKSRAAELLEQINTTHRPVIITQNGRARAVLQDPESYEEMRNTIAMLRLLAQGEQACRDGKVIPQDEVFSTIKKKLKQEK